MMAAPIPPKKRKGRTLFCCHDLKTPKAMLVIPRKLKSGSEKKLCNGARLSSPVSIPYNFVMENIVVPNSR